MEHKIQTRQKWVMLYKKVNTPRTKGFVERFNRTVLDIFFRIAFRAKSYESIEALQEDLDAWLVEYNTRRPHQGYRNRGKRPMDVIQDYLQQRDDLPENIPDPPGSDPGITNERRES